MPALLRYATQFQSDRLMEMQGHFDPQQPPLIVRIRWTNERTNGWNQTHQPLLNHGHAEIDLLAAAAAPVKLKIVTIS